MGKQFQSMNWTVEFQVGKKTRAWEFLDSGKERSSTEAHSFMTAFMGFMNGFWNPEVKTAPVPPEIISDEEFRRREYLAGFNMTKENIKRKLIKKRVEKLQLKGVIQPQPKKKSGKAGRRRIGFAKNPVTSTTVERWDKATKKTKDEFRRKKQLLAERMSCT